MRRYQELKPTVLNLNRCTVTQLDTLPSLSVYLARKIHKARHESGKLTYARVISLGVLPVVVDRWIREKLIHPLKKTPVSVMAVVRPTMDVSASTDGDSLDTPPGGGSLHEEAAANIGQATGDVPPTPVLSNAQIAQLSATDPMTPFVATQAFELRIQGQIDQVSSTNMLLLAELRSMNATMSVLGTQQELLGTRLDTMERSHPVRDPLASKLPYPHDDVYRPTLSTASKTSATGAPLFTSTPVVDPAQHVTYSLSDMPVPMGTFTRPHSLNPVMNAVGVGAISKVPTVSSPAPSMVAPPVPPVSDHANSMRSMLYKQGGDGDRQGSSVQPSSVQPSSVQPSSVQPNSVQSNSVQSTSGPTVDNPSRKKSSSSRHSRDSSSRRDHSTRSSRDKSRDSDSQDSGTSSGSESSEKFSSGKDSDAGQDQRRYAGFNPKSFHSNPKLPTFDGCEDDWEVFSFQFRELAHAGQWSKRVRLQKLISCLKGSAVKFVKRRPSKVRRNYRKLMVAMEKRYSVTDQPCTIRKQLASVTQLVDESLETWADRVYALTLDAYPQVSSSLAESLAVENFLKGCRDKRIALLISSSDKSPHTVPQAVRKMREVTETHKLFLGTKPVSPQKVRKVSFESRAPSTDSDSLRRIEKMLERLLHKPSSSQATGSAPSGLTPSGLTPSGSTPSGSTPSGSTPSGSTPSGSRPSGYRSPSPQRTSSPSGRRICYICQSPDHLSPACPQRSKSRSRSPSPASIICYVCNQAGHISRDCPENTTGSG